jgi:aspartate aminotransferase-like enzyme
MRYWFAPGPVPTEENIKIEYSHRSSQFAKLVFDLRCMLEFSLDRKVAFIQGSASAAIESVLGALWLDTERALVIQNGVFSRRVGKQIPQADGVSSIEAALKLDLSIYRAVYVVQFETGDSKLNDLEVLAKVCRSKNVLLVVDAVSSYPFYLPPPTADIVILSSSKQLRGLPVMGIVAYKPERLEDFCETHDHLSLRSAISYGDKGETPHTSLMPQMLSLHDSLRKHKWKPGVAAIEQNARTVTDGLESSLIGEVVAPVVTFFTNTPAVLSEFLEQQGLEVYWNASYMADRIQVSCYNYSEVKPYEELNEALLEARDGGWL